MATIKKPGPGLHIKKGKKTITEVTRHAQDEKPPNSVEVKPTKPTKPSKEGEK